MSREIVIKMRDDLDRSLDATETIELGVDGVVYIVDLCETNAENLRGLLKPYLEAAHEKVKPPKPNGTYTQEQREENQAIRRWAQENGFEIGKTGQIPTEVREAYRTWQPRRQRGGEAAKVHAISDKVLRDQIRTWGREHGYESHRGFLSSELVKAYEKAHGLKVSA